MTSKENNMGAGNYRIGDPCYSVADDEYDDFLALFWDAGDRGGVFEWHGCTVACFYTKYGDGVYDTEDEGYYLPVDAGCIAAIPEHLCKKDDGGNFNHEFGSDWRAESDGSTIRYGDFVIRTGDDCDEEDRCPCCGCSM